MIDQRIELRLRTDPTGDPVHEAGRFRVRMAMAAGVQARRRQGLARVPVATLLAAVLIAALLVVVRPLVLGPAATPSPTPTTSPAATFTAAELERAVTSWTATLGGGDPPISVTVIGPTGVETSFATGALPGNPPAASSARIGEVSRVYIAAGIALVDDCSTVAAEFSCRKGVFPTTMRIDDPISQWYPDWPADEPVAIRQLLDGSSGLAATATDMTDLAAQVAANPGLDWSRDTVIARAIAAPRRFQALERHDPVDTEWLLLEAVMERATGKTSSQVIPTEATAPPFNTTLVDQPPVSLMAGHTASGATLADLDPTLLALVGNAGGMASPSADLAEYALTAWATTETLNESIVDLLTDGTHGHAQPLGAVGECPCDGQTRFVIRQFGRAGGWSTVIAYDFQTRVAIGIAMGRDTRPTDLDALLQSLLAITPPS